MARDKWTDIVALYKTYIGVIIPLLREAKVIIENFDLEDLYKAEVIQGVVEKITKRKVNKVKVITEFNAYFIQEIFRHIINYIEEIKDDLEPIDAIDYILEFLDESIDAFEIILKLVVEDTKFHRKSLLFKLTNILSELIFPQGGTLEEIYTQLIEESADWYEVQRYILKPTTYYREKIDDLTIPSISPKLYQIFNNITSLFNLQPNYIDLPEDSQKVIPAIMIKEIFEPYIKNLSGNEEESFNKIINRMEMRVLYDLFLCPTEKFLKIVEPHNFVGVQQDNDGKQRFSPQFSNETLILLYLANASYRRGFLSKELINWISINYAFIIYMTCLRYVLSDSNIFYDLFLDLRTEEKILPYLMKLLCFNDYIRLDMGKIRDSPTYRKEIFNFLGNKIEALDDIVNHMESELKKILDEEK